MLISTCTHWAGGRCSNLDSIVCWVRRLCGRREGQGAGPVRRCPAPCVGPARSRAAVWGQHAQVGQRKRWVASMQVWSLLPHCLGAAVAHLHTYPGACLSTLCRTPRHCVFKMRRSVCTRSCRACRGRGTARRGRGQRGQMPAAPATRTPSCCNQPGTGAAPISHASDMHVESLSFGALGGLLWPCTSLQQQARLCVPAACGPSGATPQAG